MKTLDELCIEHGTDKASVHPVKGHNYASFYEVFFEPKRNSALKMLEIGVGSGASIRGWLDYFPNAEIHGVDVVHNTNDWNVQGHKHGRYLFNWADVRSETFWACFLADHGNDWDIIIDDGGHYNDEVITSFNCLWPAVAKGGLYCIEDLGVSYGPGSVFVKPGFPNHMDWIRSLIDQLNHGENNISKIHLFRELSIIQKN